MKNKIRVCVIGGEEFRRDLTEYINAEVTAVDAGGGALEVPDIFVSAHFDVVLLETRVLDAATAEMLCGVRRYQPESRIFIITSFLCDRAAEELAGLDVSHVLQMPVNMEYLTALVGTARSVADGIKTKNIFVDRTRTCVL